MSDMAQPQAVDTANQPNLSAAESGISNDAQEQESAAFLTVRYNKEELPLTREAAAQYAQKGLNYDKLSGRLEKAQELLTSYEDIDTAAKKYANQNGISETEALTAIKQRLRDEHQRQSVVNVQLDTFLAAHPDVDPRTLPETVIHAWKRGTPLTTAYAQMIERGLMLEQARQANARNRAASMGGAIGTGAAAPRPVTEEAIKLMSQAELSRNHSRIWAFLTGK